MSRIFKMTEKAIENRLDWDTAIYTGEIETVEEFESYEAALAYFENELGGDDEQYGIE